MKLKRFICKIILFVFLLNCILPTQIVLADEEPVYEGIQELRPPTTEVNDDDVGLSPLESMLAMLLTGMANVLHKLIALAVGYQITIDDIVFNQYPPIVVDFFEDLRGDIYSEIIWGKSMRCRN